MASDKPLVCVVYLGGTLVNDKDGSVSYTGGEAHLTDVDRDMTFHQFKMEVAEMHGGDVSGLTFKYPLPTNKKTLITISNDKDLRRMVDMNRDTASPEIYVLTKGAVPVNPPPETNNTPSRASMNSIVELPTPIPCNVERPNKLSVYWETAITGVGQLFKDVHDFRESLRKYAIAKNFGYKFVQNDRGRVTAKCKGEGCPWRIHASRVSTTKIIKVRVFKDVHTCDRIFGTQSHPPHVTRFWIADAVKKKLQDIPDYKVSDIVKDIYNEYGLKINYSQAWRGKETAREQLLGKDVDFYKQLPRYCEKLIETNPGSIAALATTNEERFHRLFVSFRACIHGFEHGCRPLLFLDGTSLKSKYGGTLLIAASLDGNDEIFPVAFAVVEQEEYVSWHWFLVQLKSALSSSRPLTFISDRHKGLQEAVPLVFEDSTHAFCLRYLTRDLKKEMKTYPKEVKDVVVELFFAAARACRKDEFVACIESIRSVSPEAATWIMDVEPERWANLFFKGSRYNQMASNVIEFIDGWITKACDFPVLKLVEAIRSEIVELFRARLEASDKWNTRLTAKAEEKMRREIDRAPLLSVSVSSALVFEVIDDHTNIVDLEKSDCTCLNWKVMGLPCRHLIASLNCIGRDAYDYCERYFLSDYYKLTYTESINPVLDVDSISSVSNAETVVDSYPNVELPKIHRQRGRPKKRRVELHDTEKRTFLCGKCKEPGHNKKTCKAFGLLTS
ncbi:uncharacterized protein LOC116248507 [Nymphaea colorata]|uniref:uncharacterized protein LOC116248507 n=1 Tax=Nymphaea colorata TaxID=210225 RepID=UPI00129E0A72|nr:uncharacterized protein LOC116248507 [Nymphaea colorata]XP_031477200.1 uncharacterized protein LOC116248507 [Nymphaea colorata]